jgi:chitodextrinase
MKTSLDFVGFHSRGSFRAVLILMLLVGLLAAPTQTLVQAATTPCRTSNPASGSYTVTVCITSPVDGAQVAGLQTVAATVTTTGTSPGISKLIFYLKGAYLLTDFQTPYSFTLPTTKWVDGNYLLEVEALMRDGYTSNRASINLAFKNGISHPPVNTNTFTPTSGSAAQPGQPFVLAATGDGAGGEANAGNVTDLISSWNPNLFLYLGDVYEKGTSAEFYNWYGTAGTFFGRFRSITDPIIGNHEYENGVAPGYFDYWDNVPNYYSFDAAGWHFIALNSNCSLLQNCGVGQAQYQWLLNDLNTHTNTCTVAYFHHPVYNVGPQGPTTTMNAIWSLMAQKGVDLVLTGHDHNYQRWVPMNANGTPSPSGMTEFVAGGGGHGIQNFIASDSRMVAGFDTSPNSLGALRFELNQYGASFQYFNYLGNVLDSGAVPCNGAPADSAAPSVPSNLTATVHSSTQADLAWSSSTDNVGVAGYNIYRNGTLLTSVGVVTSYTDTNLTQGATYTYQIKARDSAGNLSGFSNAAPVTMPSLMFSDGFETGNLAAWTSSTNLVVQQQQVYAGLYAARQTSSGAGASYASKTLSITQSDLYYGLHFKINSKGTNSAYLQRFRTSSNGAIGGVLISSTNKLGYRNDVAGTTNTTGPTVTVGVWHELQTHLLINGTSSQIEVWYDGVLVPSLSVTDNFGANPIGRLQLGDSSTANVYDIALDEVGFNPTFIDLSDSERPSIPTGLAATASAPHIVNLTWNAATDNTGVVGYDLYRNGALLTNIGAVTNFTDTPVSPSFTYHYQVRARDAAGNASDLSMAATVTTPADTTPPSVTLTAPAGGATVGGVVTLSADATDNVGIAHVDFFVNGTIVGSVEEPPYSVTWDSTSVVDGPVTISAQAVDGSSNQSALSNRSIVVNNTATPTPVITATSAPPVSVCLGAVQDTYIIQDAATKNHGSDTDMRTKPDAGKERRILIGFDLTSIPQSSAVVTSTLRLYETATKNSQTISLYRLTNNWVESQVTWNNRSISAAWAASGGDYQNTALATFLPNVQNQYRDIDVTGVTQGWVNGTYTNYGLLLHASGVNGEIKFASREVSSASQRPQLCITYQLAPAATATFTATNTPTKTATSTPTSPAAATFTPTPTASRTPTSVNTATQTPSPTPTAPSNNTATPTFTASATLPANIFTFTPSADAYVNEASPTSNYGSSALRADASPIVRSYLRFDVQGLSGTVIRVTLRIFTSSSSSIGYEVRNVADNSWVESTVNYSNAPAFDGVTATSGPFAAAVWTGVDVTPLITGNGTFSFALTTTTSTAFSLASRESGATAPQLIIETTP